METNKRPVLGIDEQVEWKCSLIKDGKDFLVNGNKTWVKKSSFRQMFIDVKKYFDNLAEVKK